MVVKLKTHSGAEISNLDKVLGQHEKTKQKKHWNFLNKYNK